MTIKSTLKDLSWTAGGAAVLIVVIGLALHYHREENAATRSTSIARRVELVERIRADLSSASEAEKSAVMATTDVESRDFAEQARAAAAVARQTRDELAGLLETGGTGGERDLLSQFSQALTEYQRIDRELLDLAVRNTNLKASGLAFGPAADALADMDGALSRILKEGAASTASGAGRVMLLAADARSGAWRIQALLPPHISEESDQRMDELEVKMANEDQQVRSNLKGLATLLGSGSPDLETATASYARFSELKARILELSRQNTNVRSLMLSLNEKRKAARVCQAVLLTLEQAIQEEPLTDRQPQSPR